jgi:hypothetical protein
MLASVIVSLRASTSLQAIINICELRIKLPHTKNC